MECVKEDADGRIEYQKMRESGIKCYSGLFCFRESSHAVNWPMIDSTAGMIKIAPSKENPTAINVTIPKLLMMGKLARQRAENPKKLQALIP